MGKGGANKVTKSQGGVNLKSVLRHEHLKNLALWSPIPSLATLFGRRLAAASDIPDLFSCQRCETILQNCKVRIEKKHMRYKKNNLVYYCNLCSHRNLKRGTAKGQMKEMYPPKTKPQPKIEKETMMVENNTPKPMLTLERDKRIRKSKSKKPIEPQTVPIGALNKRKAETRTNKSSTAVNFKIPFLLSSDPT